MKTKLVVWLVIVLGVLTLGAQPVLAGAGGSIEVISIDHNSLDITVDFELACTPDYYCVGELHWGDGGVSPVVPEDNDLYASHTYSAPGCYLVSLFVANYYTAEEAWYSAGWQSIGFGAVCQPPFGTIDVISSAGLPYSVMYDVTWENGLPAVQFGPANAGWTSNLAVGSEAISYTYGMPGTYNASLTVVGAQDTIRDSICVQVFETYALEVPCNHNYFPLLVKY